MTGFFTTSAWYAEVRARARRGEKVAITHFERRGLAGRSFAVLSCGHWQTLDGRRRRPKVGTLVTCWACCHDAEEQRA